jgi:hypothetical protein
MLTQLTVFADLFAMATTLWLAFYLFARGFPSRVTLRVVIVLLSLSAFYFGAYNNIFHQVAGTAAWRAVFLVIGLGAWYSLTYRLMPEPSRKKYRPYEIAIYLYALVTIPLLLQPGTFLEEHGNALYVAHMTGGPAYAVYGSYQIVISISILFNLLVGERIGLTPRGKYFLVASVFPTLSVIYGVISLRLFETAPRIVQDLLSFSGIFILGLSVARHQTWTERRTSLQDFPLTTLSTLGLASVTALVAWREGMPLERMSSVVGFVILAVGIYDLTREFLERLRMQREGEFRKQLRRLESESFNEQTMHGHLQKGLDLLCEALDAQGGFVAVRRGGNFVVTATRSSVPEGSELPASLAAVEDVSSPKDGKFSSIAWIAPSFEGQTQVALVGVEKPRSRTEYSRGNLELLAEVADQIGTIISLGDLQPRQARQLQELVEESRANVTELKSVSGDMLEALSGNADEEFIKLVEECLRHLPDTIALGQSPLAEKVGLHAATNIERGKQLQQWLIDSIESLKPAEKRPPEPLPRIWYNYAVLHDAYVEGVPNREIMARLYISEGTFNRTRRNAIRGLARALAERTGKP